MYLLSSYMEPLGASKVCGLWRHFQFELCKAWSLQATAEPTARALILGASLSSMKNYSAFWGAQRLWHSVYYWARLSLLCPYVQGYAAPCVRLNGGMSCRWKIPPPSTKVEAPDCKYPEPPTYTSRVYLDMLPSCCRSYSIKAFELKAGTICMLTTG